MLLWQMSELNTFDNWQLSISAGNTEYARSDICQKNHVTTLYGISLQTNV